MSDSINGSPRLHLPVIAFLLVGLLSSYQIIDAVLFRVEGVQRAIYAVVVATVICFLMFGLRELPIDRRLRHIAWIWLLAAVVFLIPSFFASPVYPGYVLGDFISITLPLLFIFAGVRFPALFAGSLPRDALIAALFAALVLGVTVGGSVNNRFEPPATALIGLIWVRLFASRSVVARIGILAAVVFVGAAAWASGNRTSVVLWLLGGAAFAGFTWRLRTLIVIGLLSAGAAYYAGAEAIVGGLQTSLAETRFQENTQGELDASLLERINEALDVIWTFGTTESVTRYVVGFGHGATFQPRLSYPVRNLTHEGVAHHIHIGPAMIFYRYGALGLAAYLGLWALVIRTLIRLRRSCLRRVPLDLAEMAFALTLLLYLIDGLLRNVLVDPLFSFVLAGFLYCVMRRPAAEAARVA